MIWHNQFFISFDNMNFYEHTQDQCFHNKEHQLNYITGYICLIGISVDRQSLDRNIDSEVIPSN